MQRGSKSLRIPISFMPDADPDIFIPELATPGSVGFDLKANLEVGLRSTGLLIRPNEIRLVGTGIMLAIPDGMEGQIRSKSGLALKNAVTVLNSPGTIDSDYRGEISVILVNQGELTYLMKHGDKIAQIVFQRILRVEFREEDSLDKTTRGASGFGSSG